MASNQARLICYETFKGNLPTKMKVSPIAEILHKSKEFRSILDLSFSFKTNSTWALSFSKKNSEKTATGVAIDKIVHTLLRLIHAFPEAPDYTNIFQAKRDIKDGFWRLHCKEGKAWNFLCRTTEAMYAKKTGGSNIASDGVD